MKFLYKSILFITILSLNHYLCSIVFTIKYNFVLPKKKFEAHYISDLLLYKADKKLVIYNTKTKEAKIWSFDQHISSFVISKDLKQVGIFFDNSHAISFTYNIYNVDTGESIPWLQCLYSTAYMVPLCFFPNENDTQFVSFFGDNSIIYFEKPNQDFKMQTFNEKIYAMNFTGVNEIEITCEGHKQKFLLDSHSRNRFKTRFLDKKTDFPTFTEIATYLQTEQFVYKVSNDSKYIGILLQHDRSLHIYDKDLTSCLKSINMQAEDFEFFKSGTQTSVLISFYNKSDLIFDIEKDCFIETAGKRYSENKDFLGLLTRDKSQAILINLSKQFQLAKISFKDKKIENFIFLHTDYGNYFYILFESQEVRLVDLDKMVELPVTSFTVSPCKRYVSRVNSDGSLLLLDFVKKKRINALDSFMLADTGVKNTTFLHIGLSDILLVNSEHNFMAVDLDNNKILQNNQFKVSSDLCYLGIVNSSNNFFKIYRTKTYEELYSVIKPVANFDFFSALESENAYCVILFQDGLTEVIHIDQAKALPLERFIYSPCFRAFAAQEKNKDSLMLFGDNKVQLCMPMDKNCSLIAFDFFTDKDQLYLLAQCKKENQIIAKLFDGVTKKIVNSRLCLHAGNRYIGCLFEDNSVMIFDKVTKERVTSYSAIGAFGFLYKVNAVCCYFIATGPFPFMFFYDLSSKRCIEAFESVYDFRGVFDCGPRRYMAVGTKNQKTLKYNIALLDLVTEEKVITIESDYFFSFDFKTIKNNATAQDRNYFKMTSRDSNLVTDNVDSFRSCMTRRAPCHECIMYKDETKAFTAKSIHKLNISYLDKKDDPKVESEKKNAFLIELTTSSNLTLDRNKKKQGGKRKRSYSKSSNAVNKDRKKKKRKLNQ